MTQTDLLLPQLETAELWHHPDWQRLWLVSQTHPWKSLAIVPASTGAPADFAVTVAITLARAGMMHLGTQIHVADGTDIKLASLAPFEAELNRCKLSGSLVLIATPPLKESALAASLAQMADRALLCVVYERMMFAEAKTTLNKIGAARFIGSVVFRQNGMPV